MKYSEEHTTNWNISDKDMNIILTALEYYAGLLEHHDKELCEYVEGLFQAIETHWMPKENE